MPRPTKPKRPPGEVLHTYMPTGLADYYREVASAAGISLSEAVRRALEETREDWESDHTEEEG